MRSRFFHLADSVNDVEVVNSANDAEDDIVKLVKEYEDARSGGMDQIR